MQAQKVRYAESANEPVDHPLLDKVRACSANPDDAADFFLQMLHPEPARRLPSVGAPHPYIAKTHAEMSLAAREYYANNWRCRVAEGGAQDLNWSIEYILPY